MPSVPPRRYGRPPQYVVRAYEAALRALHNRLDGECLAASVIMHDSLLRGGHPARLVRRELPGGDGHWTVRVGDVEYDPTITRSGWSRDMITDHGELHVVSAGSPHHAWPEDKDVDVGWAYEIAGVPYRGH